MNDGADELALAGPWQVWVAENVLRGMRPEELVAVLVDQGVARDLAEREVSSVVGHPALAGARAVAALASRLELAMSMRLAHERLSAGATTVARRRGLPPREFFERYYCTNTPVVLSDGCSRWRARKTWTLARLRDRFGDVEVEIAADRDADPDCDLELSRHRRTVTMRDFLDRVAAAGDSNDLYMVSNNRNMERAGLRALLDDVTLPRFLDPRRLAGCVSLWIGPRGTVTPLHHDTTNILFCQIQGRKRVRLASPLEPALLSATRGVYSLIDLEKPDLERFPGFRDVLVKDVTLRPGEALFIPVGWWHHVRALAPSINVSFTNFAHPNAFDWYRPGERLGRP